MTSKHKESTAEAPMAKDDQPAVYRTDLGESIPTPKIPTATDHEKKK